MIEEGDQVDFPGTRNGLRPVFECCHSATLRGALLLARHRMLSSDIKLSRRSDARVLLLGYVLLRLWYISCRRECRHGKSFKDSCSFKDGTSSLGPSHPAFRGTSTGPRAAMLRCFVHFMSIVASQTCFTFSCTLFRLLSFGDPSMVFPSHFIHWDSTYV